jgi:tetratricopeptide (TPR) repeat protein
LYTHALNEDAAGVHSGILTEEEIANAYPALIADYEAAKKNSTSAAQNLMMDLDLAYLSGDWQGLDRRIERALDTRGCFSSNWIQVIADVFGHSENFVEHARQILACDPRRSLSWFNVARSTLRLGDKEEALRIAREGYEIAPGTWLATALVRALVVNGMYDEAYEAIDRRIDTVDLVPAFKALVAAAQGDQALFDQYFEEFKLVNTAGHEWMIMVSAWGGHREDANHAAAQVDAHPFGAVTLSQLGQWCACGAPFDLDQTPNFAAKLKEGDLRWPPPAVMDYPLKDW